MPSFEHEAPLVLLRARPDMVATLLRASRDVDLPAFADARVTEADFSQLWPTEFRADLVVELLDAGGDVVLGVIVELQRSRDDDKRRSWPLYAAALHARLRCATCLLVLTDDPRVAVWARRPIDTLQPGSPFSPLVVGPEQIPRVVDVASARRVPELAVLSALAHGNEPDGLAVVAAAIETAAALDDERATLYFDLVYGGLNAAARYALEEMMPAGQHKYHSDFARHYYDAGREEGREEGREGRVMASRDLLRELIARKLGELPGFIAERIAGCDDLETLSGWILDAGSASDPARISDLFAR